MNPWFSILALVAIISSISCSSRQAPIVVHNDLSALQQELIRKTPVVDIHTHSFNSKFLPIEGVAVGNRDFHWILSLIATDRLSIGIATVIDEITEHNRRGKTCTKQMFKANGKIIRAATQRVRDGIASGRYRVRPFSERWLCSRLTIRGIAHIACNDTGKMTRLEAAAVKRFAGQMAHAHDNSGTLVGMNVGQSDGNELRGVIHFIKRMVQPENLWVSNYLQDQGHPVSTMVNHMMDLAPVYDQAEEGSTLLNLKQKTALVRRQVRAAKARGVTMLYFAPYNPFRDHWGPNAKSGKALDLVKNLYENGGAAGVKIYPPSGYRPYRNVMPRAPRTSLTRYPGRQYRARYFDGDRKITGTELDKKLISLFEWAVQNDVPLFTHCGTGEFEARKGYGVYHAHPKFWRELLESNPHLHKLRLCFGHAGGGHYWFNEGDHKEWGRIVYELCTRYPNVYCEFGAEDRIVYPKPRDHFVDVISQGIRRTLPNTKPGNYRFENKVIYGSDYFMPRSDNDTFSNFLRGYQKAAIEIEAKGHRDFYRKFFRNNAMSFLRKRLN